MQATTLQTRVVCDDTTCKAQVSIDEALGLGSAELCAAEIDIDAIVASARAYHARAIEFPMPAAVGHLYRKEGMTNDMAERTFATITRALALFAAWHDHRPDGGHLSLPDRLDLIGWHGFIIQTRQYQEFADVLGQFVHHETRGGGQSAPNLLTLALYVRVFGSIDPEVWADGLVDGSPYIVYGWCSSGTND